ncbi:MAG: site-specific integrase, partial [Tannerella sp.]|nr:site-specific integrase [Tannerella sp.]
VAQIVSYTVPHLYTGTEWNVGWYSFDPVEKKMRREKIKLNHIHSKTERRKYAADLIGRVYEQLRRGWNPWAVSGSPVKPDHQ